MRRLTRILSAVFLLLLAGGATNLALPVAHAIPRRPLPPQETPKKITPKRKATPKKKVTIKRKVTPKKRVTPKEITHRKTDVERVSRQQATAELKAALHAEKLDVSRIQRALLNGADPNVKDKDGWTALMWAARNGYTHTVRLLLDKGAQINTKVGGKTALHWPALNGHTDVVRLLLNEGAQVNAKGEYGWTALMLAARNGHTDIVRLLLNEGAQINAKNNPGHTALIEAAYYGRANTVRLLLDKGADPTVKTSKGSTALSFATTEEIEQMLRAAGAKE